MDGDLPHRCGPEWSITGRLVSHHRDVFPRQALRRGSLVGCRSPRFFPRPPLSFGFGRPLIPENEKTPDRRTIRGSHREAGDGLLSRALSGGVPSALQGLTAVFGMGTGVAPAL